MHDGPAEPSDSPEILEAEWTRPQVSDLFNDLRAGAHILHVQARLRDPSGPPDVAVSLDQAERLFHDQAVTAMQIRYEFASESWCDTLMFLPELVRIIRTRGGPGFGGPGFDG